MYPCREMYSMSTYSSAILSIRGWVFNRCILTAVKIQFKKLFQMKLKTTNPYQSPLQYSCLENPHGQRNLVDFSPWGLKESDTTEWLSTNREPPHWKNEQAFGQPSVNFLVYNVVILCFYTLHNDDQDTSSYRSSPYNVSAVSWTLFPSLYVASPWHLFHKWNSVLLSLSHPLHSCPYPSALCQQPAHSWESMNSFLLCTCSLVLFSSFCM